MVKSKTVKTQSSPSLENAIDKLVRHYPNGFTRGYWNRKYMPNLTHEEIKLLLDKVSSNKNQFTQLMTHDLECAQLFKLRQDKLITNWFNNLIKADEQRTSDARTKARKIEQSQQRKIAAKKLQKRLREKRKAEALAAKNKAKRKAALWKELNLSSDQKNILRKLAQ